MARGGIDLGGTKIQAVVVDGRWKVRGESRRPTPTTGGPEGVAEQMAEAMREAAEAAGVRAEKLQAIGVGSPGEVDERKGTVSQARNLPGWDGAFELGPWLAEKIGPEVKVGNDVQVATEGEFALGAGRPYESLLGVFWGTGVGGGIILDGKPWLGRGSAGEIGHMVVKQGGAHCPCGRRGCLEAYAGRAAMEAKARKEHEEGAKTDLFKIMTKHDRDRLTSGIWARALKAGDELAHRADRPRRGGARHRNRVSGQPARHRSRDHRRRDRHPPGRAIREANRRGDDAAPVQRLAPAGPAGRLAGRPWRRDRRSAADEALAPQAGRAPQLVPSAQHLGGGADRLEIAPRIGRQRLKRLGEQVSQPAGRRASSHLHLIGTGAEDEALDSSALAGRRVTPKRQRQPCLRPVAPRCRRRHRIGPGAIPRARSPTRRAGAPTTTPAPRRRARAG